MVKLGGNGKVAQDKCKDEVVGISLDRNQTSTWLYFVHYQISGPLHIIFIHQQNNLFDHAQLLLQACITHIFTHVWIVCLAARRTLMLTCITFAHGLIWASLFPPIWYEKSIGLLFLDTVSGMLLEIYLSIP